MTHNRNFNSQSTTFSRREVLQAGGVGILGFLLSDVFFTLENAGAAETAFPPLNRSPRMMQEYLVRRVREKIQQNRQAKRALHSREEAEIHVRQVREKIRMSFGEYPDKTPLNPRIVGTIERDAYRIEKLIFESRPGFLVTSNLYIPKNRPFPRPGVVGTCGHSATGKTIDAYQTFAQGLARLGYVVLIYDPIGQGERLQYADENLKSRIGVGVREHLHAGNQQFLVGEFLGSWRAWDGIRALDYLLTREEVDANQIGVTGNSGGGTMTTWLCGWESRWSMGAPSCFVTSFLRNAENELPADTEQCPPKALALGLDHEDFIAAMAPKPVILLGKERDYFDVRGLEGAYQRLQHLYGLLGAKENIELFVGPTYHGYSLENREAMYRYFNAITGSSNLRTEPEIVLEDEKDLWCTPNGQVCELQSRTVFSFTQEKSQRLAGQRKGLKGRALADAVRSVLKMPESGGAPEYRILRNMRSRKYPKPEFTTYMVNTEPGIHAFVYRLGDERLYSRPPKDANRTILYISHLSSDSELRDEPLIRELIEAEPGAALFTCDVRGIGETLPNTCDQNFFDPYGCDYFYAIHSLMLDSPYVGQRTFDALRVIDWLMSNDHNNIHLAAKGWGALPAAFAALLSDAVQQVTLKNALTSYTDIAETEYYQWPLSTLLPDILEQFDLPDCYRELEKKGLRIIDPWSAAYQK
ncbi:MAG: prolyl oligopeptidase family serine peptidase [Candidatus Omnitrophica bacterium]|nr:prolyl oligopeptidase family serine peptidase [Candidatus Omnitrophota bacterium]